MTLIWAPRTAGCASTWRVTERDEHTFAVPLPALSVPDQSQETQQSAKVGKLERIINVSNLKVANVKKPGDAGVRHTYVYAPSESVVSTCVTTTFFSKDNFTQPAAPAPPAKK